MSKILKSEEARSIILPTATLKSFFSPRNGDTKNLSFLVGYFNQGEKLAPHIHPESEEVYYILEGRGTVYLGEDLKEILIEPNMGLYVPPGMAHGVINTEKERLVIAFFTTPGKEPSKEYKK
jgi:mannose-6-phosphate isomerase-like protein (cupin superfamily)